MLFGKHRKRASAPGQAPNDPKRSRSRRAQDAQGPPPGVVRIDFNMMRKGYIIKRGARQVRQIGVTVHGSTRLVTSGDLVDQATYQALVCAGIVEPPQDAEVTPEPEDSEE